ncbi:hypothetical protein [Sandaracinus amylolyticus]|uniref:Uncharacterized protein n=1 Tax=Sandaracinus amylolyticus TaxID=927083 RepID=A0A0F6YH28_9BACT|nr:hypothetical protein [Sandaracinus amylolyticus]AKF04353.1 hypothetical protein DB32_001502 [Sandaracinus amylolyticus]
MRDETVLTLGFGVLAIAIGAFVWPIRRRHLLTREGARAAGHYLPLFDARGVWLWLNGPVTFVLGLGLLANGALRARAEHDAARIERELRQIVIACEPGRIELRNLGDAPRVLEVDARADHPHRDPGPRLRIEPEGAITLPPGTSRSLALSTVTRGACGTEPGGDHVTPWEMCDGAELELAIRDPHGDEVARGASGCAFPGRARVLQLGPDFLW